MSSTLASVTLSAPVPRAFSIIHASQHLPGKAMTHLPLTPTDMASMLEKPEPLQDRSFAIQALETVLLSQNAPALDLNLCSGIGW